ncbi:MAG: filamentous hemagglutinin family protein [Gammaproteobacteria bacterium]|nr:filamentous hemagglutinin family protein [Gammaproteobacteria bacterium]MBU1482918.1 filamentous hemagglutinin family protein [Gammaproteobacteria bacterium]
MKKDRQTPGIKRLRAPQIGRLSLLVSALVATGVLLPLSLPEAAAAPLPMPCGGCFNNAHIAVPFQQSGTLFNLDPFTGLPAVSSDGTIMTINQSSQTAILNWKEFNIGEGHKVVFNQYYSDEVTLNNNASTLNRVWDTTLNPSRIAGSLTANGQVYLINRNGIVFTKDARVQVNTGALIASSLDIGDDLYKDGYLTNVLNGVMPAFGDGVYGLDGFVKVETGAILSGSRIMMFAPVVENQGSISTPDGQTVLAAGDKIYIEASQDPNLRGVLVEVDINNPGVANAILADNAAKAGVALQHTEAGVVTNSGDVIAQRGNITLVGFAVNQQGRLSATTSVTENGSIKLLARYGVETNKNTVINGTTTPVSYDIRAKQTGKVTLASGSVTSVTAQEIWDPVQQKWIPDPATTNDGQDFAKSIVEVMGNTIEMQNGSSIIAPSGQVTLAAIGSLSAATGAMYQQVSSKIPFSSFLNPDYVPLTAGDQARVFLDGGSLIDVSGSDASVSVARNILTVQLRGSQLADAPVQRTSRTLWGKDVQVDMRDGTTLASYAAEESQVGRTVAERTSTGGTVKLVSTGDVVMKQDAVVDISGGQVEYTGANIKTTKVISHGVAYDISEAPPDQIYAAVLGDYTVEHKKWGITETFGTMSGGDLRDTPTLRYDTRWDPGYVEGKSAGKLTVLAPTAVIDGDIVANTVAGAYQRQVYVAPPKDPETGKDVALPYKDTWQMLAKGGTLVIGNADASADENGLTNYVNDSNVAIREDRTTLDEGFTASGALPAEFRQDIVLDADLFGGPGQVNNLEVYSNRKVTVDEGVTIDLATGGSLTLKGDTVDMLGSIDTPSGMVSLGTAATTASANQLAGALTAGAADGSSVISTRGQWVNDSTRSGVPDLSRPLAIDGGKITLASGSDLLVSSGTRLDASGGAWLDMNGKTTGGNGGDITLKSGKVIGKAFNTQLDGVELRSYGTAGGKGGSLTIAANDIVLGGSATTDDTTLALAESFFRSGGFTSYNLTAQGFGGLLVSAGAIIEPKAQSLVLDRTAYRQESGADVAAFSTVEYLPDWQRAATSITLEANNNGTLKVDEGAVIRVDPTGNIKLSATNQLTVLGTLEAAAGSIDLSLKAQNLGFPQAETGSIWLGSNSRLLSAGYFKQAQPNTQNLVKGEVLAGGKINIDSQGRFVVAQKGSLMDVSGTSADIDLPQLEGGNLVYRRTHVAGDAGSIAVKTSEGGFLDGTMKAGVEAGSQAAAGKFALTLQLNPGFSDTVLPGYAPLTLPQVVVTDGGTGSYAADEVGLTPGDDAGAGTSSLAGVANRFLVDARALKDAGFDQVALRSEHAIVLADGVDLHTRRSLTLDAPELVSHGDSSVSSALITIGQLYDADGTNNQELLDQRVQNDKPLLKPTAGTGTLSVSGQMVDVTGNFMVSGVERLDITSSGDIRLNGALDQGTFVANKAQADSLTGSLRTQGNIVLQADQVYASTLAQYNLSVEDGAGARAGSITILPGDTAGGTVLSAGSKLTLSATEIVQNGVLKAPMGTLILEGDKVTLGTGSLTSVSANGAIIPFGLVEGGNAWKYDLTGAGQHYVTFSTPPEKKLTLTAPVIDVQDGATMDLSGGGDLYAYEFFAGSGGSKNVLDPANAPANTYAILPGLSGYAPYDPQYNGQQVKTGSNTMLQPGASIYLAGGDGLAAGYYTLLPASYALLPGAYRVTAVSGYTDRQPALGATMLLDGTQIMAGRFAVVGGGIQDARYSGFKVSPSSVVRNESEFHDSYANAFYAEQAVKNEVAVPRLALDGGQLIISAVGANADLTLKGNIYAAPVQGGLGALVDLDGPGFAIVASKGPANGLVQLTAESLNSLGANSLLIGGVREQGEDGMSIKVGASQVVVDNAGSVLSGPEIILAAKDAVTVKAGSDIEGRGAFTGEAQNITVGSATVNGDGALLRVSSAAQVGVSRTNLSGAAATLTVENGATVGAEDAVLLDASSVTTVGDSAIVNAKSFSVSASDIDIGDNPVSGANSLALRGALLERALAFDSLTLHSYHDINFFGGASLGGLDASQQHLMNDLVIDASNLNGFNNTGLTNVIDAANVTLLNSNTGTTPAPAYGGGNLTINADHITLGAGDKSIRGFDTVTLAAAGQIVAQDKGTLTLSAGDAVVHKLVLQATQITATNGSDLTIDAGSDLVSIEQVAGAAAPDAEALNAKLTIIGKRIVDNGTIDLAAGSVTLHATGTDAADGVTLGSGSSTSATGLAKTISGQTRYAQAGSVSLIADNGDIDIQNGALVDVSGVSDGGDAGTINISATKGAVTVAGELKGAANAQYAQGSFVLDANTLAGTGNALTNLNDILTAGGFTQLRDLRVRSGDLVLEGGAAGSSRARAQNFRLVADAGTIEVSGTVDASGADGGSILLAANGDLTLNADALLDAHATDDADGKGGKVTLSTRLGQIELNNQPIDVHGAGNTGGSVLLRAPRINNNTDVALNNTGGTNLNFSSGTRVVVEAFKTYTAPAELTSANAATTTTLYRNEAAAFAGNATAIKTRLGMLGDPDLHVTPGVELDSSGDITLATDWDLSGWRFNDGNGGVTESGILTFRAAGNLNFGSGTTQASLTDGFTVANNVINVSNGTFPTMTSTATESWSYRLVAGADSSSADVMAVNSTVQDGGAAPATGNVVLIAGRETVSTGNNAYSGANKFYMEQIRTGTGFIDIAAGGNLSLGNQESVIYTAGQMATGLPTGVANNGKNYFGVNGGDISINVKGDVIGAATDELITDWQWRQGALAANGVTYTAQPAWWINIGSFRQNIGALGGGDVSVRAGRDIVNLSASSATSGYLDTATKQTVMLGGGDLNVSAGGNINSGIFYVGNGSGSIRAGGDFGMSRQAGTVAVPKYLYTVLAMGQADFDVRAGGDLTLQAVVNPTVLPKSWSQNPTNLPGTGAKAKNYYFTYGEDSGVALSSLSGDVTLGSTLDLITKRTDTGGFFYLNTVDVQGISVYPGSLTAAALDGSIIDNSRLTLFPSANGKLDLVAANNIDLLDTITLSDTDPARLGPVFVTDAISTLEQDVRLGHESVHELDTQPVILSAGGSIGGTADDFGGLVSPKAVQAQAGGNVQYMGFTVQNMHDTDTTSIVAGKDILNPSSVTIYGPGQLVLQAGRNVVLGSTYGVISKGNLLNPSLPDEGADVTVLAGVGAGAATQDFIDRYIDPNAPKTYGSDLVEYVADNWTDLVSHGHASGTDAPADMNGAQARAYFTQLSQPLQDAFSGKNYNQELIDFVSKYGGTPDMTAGEAFAYFNHDLSGQQRAAFAQQVFFSELRDSGRYAVTTKNYQTGFEAIATLFPAGQYKGDIDLYYSQIKTTRGGDINLLAPGGMVNAGLANPPTTVTEKAPSELGIITGKGGDINAFVDTDFMVNQSRVFTLQGGNILMWASNGDIDAGKGSKSVSSTPPPVPLIDLSTGTFEMDLTRSVVGSGIAVLLANENVVAGSVDLIAPNGEVNAGDAGIRSAGDIYIAAPIVIGADNISFGGTGAGVPVAAPAAVSVGLNLQDASQAADEATQSIASLGDMNANDFKPTFLSIEVIGLGDKESDSDQ